MIILHLASMMLESDISQLFYLYKIRFFKTICNLHINIIILRVNKIILHIDVIYLACRGRNLPPYVSYCNIQTINMSYMSSKLDWCSRVFFFLQIDIISLKVGTWIPKQLEIHSANIYVMSLFKIKYIWPLRIAILNPFRNLNYNDTRIVYLGIDRLS